MHQLQSKFYKNKKSIFNYYPTRKYFQLIAVYKEKVIKSIHNSSLLRKWFYLQLNKIYWDAQDMVPDNWSLITGIFIGRIKLINNVIPVTITNPIRIV